MVLLLVITVMMPALALADFTGEVVRVIDGDTLEIMRDGKPERVRLEGIDAPELRQAYGSAAKRFAAAIAFGREAHVVEHGRDRYGRVLGDVLINGADLNEQLVAAGMAWWYRRYSSDPILAALEAEARRRHLGLWADPHPVPPWSWRSRGE